MHACTADTQGRGRCRSSAQEGDQDGFCSLHAQQRDNGRSVAKAGLPSKILLKANINPRWAELFEKLGIPVKTPDFAKREAKHVADAKRVGREAYAVRKDIADSGVPVFGNEGAQDVLVVEPLDTLFRSYNLTDMHIFQRRDKGVMNVLVLTVLVLTFEKCVAGERKLELPVDVAKFFAMSKWGFAHVWANPPKPDGTVLHTVNLAHRGEEAAKRQLLFADGLWAVEKVAS